MVYFSNEMSETPCEKMADKERQTQPVGAKQAPPTPSSTMQPQTLASSPSPPSPPTPLTPQPNTLQLPSPPALPCRLSLFLSPPRSSTATTATTTTSTSSITPGISLPSIPPSRLFRTHTRHLGSGATAAVRTARLDGTHTVAVKAFRQTSSAAAAYRREARAYAVLRGSADGVAACYGVVVQDDETDEDDAEGRMCVRNPNMYQHALVLELCRGGSLADVLEGDILSSAKCIQVALRVSEALAALHGAGWSHGDMKPANVGFIGKGGEGVRLLDLGAARRTKEELCGEDEGEEALDGAGWSPREGAVRTGGTAAYRAPEAWKGRKALRGSGAATAADVWSLGILLWEIETWRRPWEGCSEWAIFGKVCKRAERPPWPSTKERVRGLRQVADACLSCRGEFRPSASAVSHMLSNAMDTIAFDNIWLTAHADGSASSRWDMSVPGQQCSPEIVPKMVFQLKCQNRPKTGLNGISGDYQTAHPASGNQRETLQQDNEPGSREHVPSASVSTSAYFSTSSSQSPPSSPPLSQQERLVHSTASWAETAGCLSEVSSSTRSSPPTSPVDSPVTMNFLRRPSPPPEPPGPPEPALLSRSLVVHAAPAGAAGEALIVPDDTSPTSSEAAATAAVNEKPVGTPGEGPRDAITAAGSGPAAAASSSSAPVGPYVISVGQTGVIPSITPGKYAQHVTQRGAREAAESAEQASIAQHLSVGLEDNLPEGSALRPAVAKRDWTCVIEAMNATARDPVATREALRAVELMLGEGVQQCHAFISWRALPQVMKVVARHARPQGDAAVAEGFCLCVYRLAVCRDAHEEVQKDLFETAAHKFMINCMGWFPAHRGVVSAGAGAVDALAGMGDDMCNALITLDATSYLQRAMRRAAGSFDKDEDIAIAALSGVAAMAAARPAAVATDVTLREVMKCCAEFQSERVDEIAMRILVQVIETDAGRMALLAPENNGDTALVGIAELMGRCQYKSTTLRRGCHVVKSLVTPRSARGAQVATAAIVSSPIIEALLCALQASEQAEPRAEAIGLASDALDALRKMTSLGGDICGALHMSNAVNAVERSVEAHNARDVIIRAALLVERLARSECGASVSSIPTREFYLGLQSKWQSDPLVHDALRRCVDALDDGSRRAKLASTDLLPTVHLAPPPREARDGAPKPVGWDAREAAYQQEQWDVQRAAYGTLVSAQRDTASAANAPGPGMVRQDSQMPWHMRQEQQAPASVSREPAQPEPHLQQPQPVVPPPAEQHGDQFAVKTPEPSEDRDVDQVSASISSVLTSTMRPNQDAQTPPTASFDNVDLPPKIGRSPRLAAFEQQAAPVVPSAVQPLAQPSVPQTHEPPYVPSVSLIGTAPSDAPSVASLMNRDSTASKLRSAVPADAELEADKALAGPSGSVKSGNGEKDFGAGNAELKEADADQATLEAKEETNPKSAPVGVEPDATNVQPSAGITASGERRQFDFLEQQLQRGPEAPPSVPLLSESSSASLTRRESATGSRTDVQHENQSQDLAGLSWQDQTIVLPRSVHSLGQGGADRLPGSLNLPPGWEVGFGGPNGDTPYYYHAQTDTSQWAPPAPYSPEQPPPPGSDQPHVSASLSSNSSYDPYPMPPESARPSRSGTEASEGYAGSIGRGEPAVTIPLANVQSRGAGTGDLRRPDSPPSKPKKGRKGAKPNRGMRFFGN